jgi:hypothetical protein
MTFQQGSLEKQEGDVFVESPNDSPNFVTPACTATASSPVRLKAPTP